MRSYFGNGIDLMRVHTDTPERKKICTGSAVMRHGTGAPTAPATKPAGSNLMSGNHVRNQSSGATADGSAPESRSVDTACNPLVLRTYVVTDAKLRDVESVEPTEDTHCISRGGLGLGSIGRANVDGHKRGMTEVDERKGALGGGARV